MNDGHDGTVNDGPDDTVNNSPDGTARNDPDADGSGTGTGARAVGRLLLGAALVFAGIAHLTSAREEFQAQVPSWVPVDEDLVVVVSGVIEIAIGLGLLAAPQTVRPLVGVVAAAFFVAIFPGNIGQWQDGVDAFGLDTDEARFARLFFQPVLVAVALWSTGGWGWLRSRLRR